MNEIVIIFVPAGMKQRTLESALRDGLSPPKIGNASPKTNPVPEMSRDAENVPLWTWFLPNPLR
jgi:hypothetical protein